MPGGVEIRTLRVSAEMDASKYSAGAAQKVAADAKMVAGAKQVDVALTQTDAKVTQSLSPVQRLSRQYVDGAAASMKFEAGLRGLNTMLERGKIDAQQASTIYAGMAQKLGLVANSTNIASQGFARLATVVDTTNKRMAQMPAARNAAMPANDNLQMYRRAQLGFQLQDVGVSLASGLNPLLIAAQQGSQIATIYGGQGGVNALLRDTLGLFAKLANPVVLGITAAATVAVGAIAGLRSDTEDLLDRTVTFGDTFSAVFKVIGQDIMSYLQPVIDDIAPWFKAAFEGAADWAVWGADKILNSFEAAFYDVKFVWEQFPNMMEAVVFGAINSVISGVETMLNGVVDRVNSFIDSINAALTSIMGPGSKIGRIEGFTFGGQLSSAAADNLARATQDRNAAIDRIMGQERIRDYGKSVRDRAQAEIGVSLSDQDGQLDPWANMRDADQSVVRSMRDALKDADKATMETRKQFRGLADDILEAVKAGESFADTMKKIAEAVLSKVLDSALDQLSELLFPTYQDQGFNAGPFGVLGQLLGIGGGAAAGAVQQPAGTGWGGLREVAGAVNPSIANAGSTIDFARGQAVAYRNAIASIESAGSGGYSAIGPTNATMGRAMGRYQIMEANIGPWSEAALGRRVSSSEFMGSSSIQDSIFDHRFGGYVKKYGERGAAQAWFGGEGSVGKLGRSDVLGTTVGEYGERFTAAVEKSGQALDTMTTQAVGATTGLGGLGQGLSQLASSLMSVGGGSGGGGWFSGLMGMFGGAGGATSFMNSISPAATTFIAGGGVGLFHSGGIAGQATSFRSVDPRVFIGAPRYHNGGLVGGEVPAILQRGEVVVPRGGSGRASGGGMHITWGWEKGSDGNITPIIRDVVQTEGRNVARQEAGAAVGSYDYRQRQGGAAADDRRFNKLKRRV